MQFTPMQRRVIDTRDKNILVSAAAGSGKTAVLVERIIQRLMDEKQPLDVDRLLVVTFTKAAASEMRERIGKAIEERIYQLGKDEETIRLRLSRQATLLHRANICTIDSFCNTILRNYFDEAQIDPGFRIADENELRLLSEDILAELLEEEYEKAEPVFLNLADYYCTKKTRLEDMILQIRAYSQSMPFPTEYLEGLCKAYEVSSADEILKSDWMQDLIEAVRKRIVVYSENLKTIEYLCHGVDAPHEYLDTLREEQDILTRLVAIKDYRTLKQEMDYKRPRLKPVKNANEEYKEVFKKARDDFYKKFKKVREDFLSDEPEAIFNKMQAIKPYVEYLAALAREYDRRLWEEKKKKNILDFSDLEHVCLSLVVKNEKGYPSTDLAKELREHFDEIMIDEYQDSNQVQELLLSRISGEEDGRNNRFMVGDVKQSIYRFRMADPSIFMSRASEYSSRTDCEKIDLDQNFRSRREVLNATNDVFKHIMTWQTGDLTYGEAESLKLGASFPETDSDYTAELMLVKQEGASKDPELEARAVAKRIKNLHGILQVSIDSKNTRPCEYRDIALLLRSTGKALEIYKKVFEEEGVPAFIATRTGYFDAPEVRVVLCFLNTLNNPREDIALYGTMVSEVGGFGEEEIALLKPIKKKSLYDNLILQSQEYPEGELKDKLNAFLTMVGRYRDKALFMPIHELLMDFYEESGFLLLSEAMPAGSRRKANLLRLIEEARKYEQTSFHGLFHFVRYIENLKKYAIDYGDADLGDENADVVRLMTIHKSKGLEFPVCIVAGLGKDFNFSEERNVVALSQKYGIGMDYINPQFKIKKDMVYKNVLLEKERRAMIEEELRVLYVAMTRAKEKLILSALVTEKTQEPNSVFDADGFLQLLLYAKKKDLSILIRENYVNQSDLSGEVISEAVDKMMQKEELLSATGDEEKIALLKERFQREYHSQKLKGLFTKTSVSELKHAAMHSSEDQEEADRDEQLLFPETESKQYIPSFVGERDLGGTTTGNAYHKVMELMDFSIEADEEKIKSYLQELVDKERLLGEYKDKIYVNRIAAFLRSDLGKRMAKASERGLLHREQPFVISLPASQVRPDFPEGENVLIQGIIDAYFEEDGEIVLMDYKTDRVDNAEELIRRYHTQLDYYSQTLNRLSHKRVKEVLIYSFALGKTIDVPHGLA